MTTTIEPAERLRKLAVGYVPPYERRNPTIGELIGLVQQAERRATVERIRARIAELNVGGTGLFDVEYQDILDEEAAR